MTTFTQAAFDFAPLVTPECDPTASLADKFEAFHSANPHVADALEHLAGQWLARHRKVGVKALVERLRWESGIQTTGSAYRINNSHTAFYARLLLERRPDWAGRIEVREQKAMA